MQEKIAFTRFDYFAHGKSEGEFTDFTIGRALESALEMLDHIATGPQLLVGSSMGGWLALLASLERKRQVKAFVGIAAAPDFRRACASASAPPSARSSTATA
ncbi:MAG: alpha/beta fold hydrolase [Alphaproteobacteria bacterium]